MRTTILILALLCCCAVLVAWAPAPLPRRHQPPRADLAGAWHLRWGERGDYAMTLGAGGLYEASGHGSHWEGEWKHSGRRTLWVSESPCVVGGGAGVGARMTWTVELDAALCGRTDGGVRVSLEGR